MNDFVIEKGCQEQVKQANRLAVGFGSAMVPIGFGATYLGAKRQKSIEGREAALAAEHMRSVGAQHAAGFGPGGRRAIRKAIQEDKSAALPVVDGRVLAAGIGGSLLGSAGGYALSRHRGLGPMSKDEKKRHLVRHYEEGFNSQRRGGKR